MAKQFLDKDGLTHFWTQIKNKFVRFDKKQEATDTQKDQAIENLGLSAVSLNGLLEALGVHVGTTDPAEVDTDDWGEGDLYIWVNNS